ncbi:BgiBFREP1 [Biomphalaria glabrata]|nr:BgiBFREP1 [Biomphalaria glabrata]
MNQLCLVLFLCIEITMGQKTCLYKGKSYNNGEVMSSDDCKTCYCGVFGIYCYNRFCINQVTCKMKKNINTNIPETSSITTKTEDECVSKCLADSKCRLSRYDVSQRLCELASEEVLSKTYFEFGVNVFIKECTEPPTKIATTATSTSETTTMSTSTRIVAKTTTATEPTAIDATSPVTTTEPTTTTTMNTYSSLPPNTKATQDTPTSTNIVNMATTNPPTKLNLDKTSSKTIKVRYLRLAVTPSAIELGKTEALLIYCSLPESSSTPFQNLVSLKLSHSIDKDVYPFKDLASINVADGRVNAHNNEGSGGGVISNTEEPFLSFLFPFPYFHMAGDYRCLAQGNTSDNQPLTLMAIAKVFIEYHSLVSISKTLRSLRLEQIQNGNKTRQQDAIGTKQEDVGGYNVITNRQPVSCRDVNSTEDRMVVTLASGLKVMCDTKTDGGGWIIFQRRINGKVDFYRGWKEYRDGFGDYNIGEFYLGNENIFMLTSGRQYELRIDMEFKTKKYFAKYSRFKVLSEANNYQLKIESFSGNAGDSLTYHNDQFFSTFDRDNDRQNRSNCAVTYLGAWWYNACLYANLNGKWGSREYGKGLIWLGFTSPKESVTSSEMKMRETSRQ